MKLNKLAHHLALIGLCSAGAAIAQTAPPADQPTPPATPVQKIERVEVTGSSIKRVADQGALPLQVITAAQMERTGITSAEDLLRNLSANVANANNSVSSNATFGGNADKLTGGSDFANLRGLGPSGTLVLLNGRRLSAMGMSGAAVDLNAIPFEMIERVEVLKDGAGAIYGADAVGGVINFILKKEYTGLQVNTTYSSPFQSGGGQRQHIALTGGIGELAEQGWNVMGSVSYDNNKELYPGSRTFANGYQPQYGLVPDTSSAPGFANIPAYPNSAFQGGTTIGGGSTVYTSVNALALQNNCGAFPFGVSQVANATVLSGFGYSVANNTYRCGTNYGSQYMLATPQEKESGVLRGTLVLSPTATGFVEFVGSRFASMSQFTPNQLSSYSSIPVSVNAATNPQLYQDLVAAGVNPAGNGSGGTIANYPVTGPYYAPTIALLQSLGVQGLKTNLPIAYRARFNDWGDRTLGNVSYNTRLTVGVDGSVGDYDYNVALAHGVGNAFENMVNGYQDANGLVALLASGVYNPFLMPGQTQSAAAQAAIAANEVHGRLYGGRTLEDELTGTFSGKVMNLPAGEMDFAVGTDLRREAYGFSGNGNGYNCISTLSAANLALPNTVFNCPGSASAPTVTQNVAAVFGELHVPILKTLEAQLAVRHDDYEHVAGTTNPKVGLKFTPTKDLLFRASYGTGFKAPTPQQLNLGTVTSESGTTWVDQGCPTPGAASCLLQGIQYQTGGNPNLKPETSKQGGLGIVISPLPGLQASADYWQVNMHNRINYLAPTTEEQNYNIFQQNFIRNPDGTLNYIVAGWINSGGSLSKGIDFNVTDLTQIAGGKLTTILNSTKVITEREQLYPTVAATQLLGQFNDNGALFVPWRTSVSSTFAKGAWTGTLSAQYSSSYQDENHSVGYTSNTALYTRQVASYTTWNLFGGYSGIKRLTLTAGIINLFNRQPPFTWHDVDNSGGAGWDPRVADARGRTLQVGAKYAFF